MNQTIDYLWEKVLEKALSITESQKKDYVDIVVYTDSEKLFRENFKYYHKLVKDTFMQDFNNEKIRLDRHKIAAITICSILSADVLGISQKAKSEMKDKNDPRNAFLANEKLAVDVALSHMYEVLKQEIQAGKVQIDDVSLLDNFNFPVSLSCPEKKYDEILCRELYFSKKYFEVCPMSIANVLFLLEMYAYPSLKSVTTKVEQA